MYILLKQGENWLEKVKGNEKAYLTVSFSFS